MKSEKLRFLSLFLKNLQHFFHLGNEFLRPFPCTLYGASIAAITRRYPETTPMLRSYPLVIL